MLKCGRCGSGFANAAACAALVFGVRVEDAAGNGRTSDPVCLANVAFE